jgi:hypothetical protein
MPVRLGPEPLGRDIIFQLAQHIVESVLGNVPPYLLVPLVIFSPVQPRRELDPLFERELFDRRFDFRETHIFRLSPDRRPSNVGHRRGVAAGVLTRRTIPT